MRGLYGDLHKQSASYGWETRRATSAHKVHLQKCAEDVLQYMIHCKALSTKQLSPELNDVMTNVIAMVNFIKT